MRIALSLFFAVLFVSGNAAHALPTGSPIELPTSSPEDFPGSGGDGSDKKSFKPSDAAVDQNVLRRAEESVRIGQEAGPMNNFRSIDSGSLYDIDTNPDYGRFGTASSWCVAGGPGCADFDGDSDFGGGGDPTECGPTGCVTYTGETAKYTAAGPASRKSVVTSFAPLAGVRDAMEGDVSKDLNFETMTSKLAYTKMAFRLTEPAIAESIHESFIEASTQTQLRMQAHQAFIETAKANPDIGQVTLSAYFACIQRRMSEGRPWQEAQSRCMGGDRITKNTGIGAGTGQFDNATPESHFILADDPNSPNSKEMGDVIPGAYLEGDRESIRANRISAVDYLFNQLAHRDGGSKWTKQKVALFKKDYRGMIGDVIFFFRGGGGGVEGSTQLYNPGRGMFQIYVRTLRPFNGTLEDGSLPDDFGPDTLVQTTPAERLYRNLVLQRYEDIWRGLRYYCEAVEKIGVKLEAQSGSSGGGFVGPPAPPSPPNPGQGVPLLAEQETGSTSEEGRSDPWTDSGGAQQAIIRLSMPGMRVKPRALESIIRLYSVERAASTPFTCAELDATDPSNRLSLTYAMTPLAGGGADSDIPKRLIKNSSLAIRSAFALAQRVAFGQYLGSLAKAEDFVNQISGGGYDSMVRKHMLDMIYSAAGTKEIRLALHRNVREAQAVLDKINIDAAKKADREE